MTRKLALVAGIRHVERRTCYDDIEQHGMAFRHADQVAKRIPIGCIVEDKVFAHVARVCLISHASEEWGMYCSQYARYLLLVRFKSWSKGSVSKIGCKCGEAQFECDEAISSIE